MDWAEGKEQKINAFLTVKESGNGYTGSFKENTDQSSYVFVDSTIIDPTFIPNEVRANITCNCGQEYAKLKQEPVVYVSDCCTKRGCQGTCTTKYRDSMYVNKVSRRKEYGWVPVINESNFGTTEEGTTNYYIEDFECPCSNSLLGRNQDSIFVNLFTLVTIFGYPLFSVLLSFLMFFCNMINSGEVMFNKGRRVVVSDTGTKLADGSDLVVNLMEKERNGHDSFSNGCSVGNGKSKKKGKQRGNSAQGRTELPQENGPKNRKSSSPLKMNRKSDSPIPCNGHLSNGDHCNNTYSNLSDVDEKFEDCLTSYKESIEVNSKLKEDLEKQKELEEELNKKINKLENNEYTLSAEIAILQLKVDSLESKNSIINKTREKDALTIQKLDKLVTDSGLKKVELEKELANERKKALVKEKVLVYECSVNCKHKVALYEAEIEKLKDSNKTKEHTISSMSSKLRVFEEEAKKSPINEYSIEFIKMRETVEHLQNSLSDETKFKQVLFRGLMTAKNEIETLTEQIRHLGGKVSPKSYIYDCNQGSSQTSPSADGAIINGN
uniref:PH domain-containing protein n=1 Tax=Rhabditophanes sp. KR3021 TaxID=114890 RepID=A0AC35TFS9_9BILA